MSKKKKQKKLKGFREATAFRNAMYSLIETFEEEGEEIGLSDRMIDAHLAAIFIEFLCLIVEERETYSADGLLGVIKKELLAAEEA